MLNSLRDEGFEGARVAAALKKTNLDPRRRAETFTLSDFADLTVALQ